ncbi:MAG: hypothetical protein ACFFG0_31645 [Candidatus Thorarchaeota archaeon]
MEKITSIIKEVNEKKGRQWLGLQPKTEQQLMSLAWYLNHPKLQEEPEKIEEIVGLYYNAKANDFLHMEKIARKLDELSVKIGKVGPFEKITLPTQAEKEPMETPKGPLVVNYGKAIEDLRNRIGRLLNSPSGSNLHENTQISISTFLNYLNHPDLQNNPELFDEMLKKYEEVETVDFTSMQTFNDLLNKMEIKLGTLSEEMKTWKSIDERESDLIKEMEKIEEEKQNLKEGWEKLEAERKDLKLEWEHLVVEKGNWIKEQEKFNEERQKFVTERAELTLEKAELSREQSKLESEKEKLNTVRKELEEMEKKLEDRLSKIS